MGRPINPSKIGSGSGKIQVTNYRLSGELEAGAEEGLGAFIVSQRSTRKFKISATKPSDSSTVTEVCTLVNKAAGALAESEFRISAINPLSGDSSTDNVSKLCNRTVTVGGIGADASSGTDKFKVSIADGNNTQGGAAVGDEDFDATSVAALGIANIDSQ
tara:strand:+ start:309 stop:788 length:480 start_codon:yes stop_codon:yes gene_type:complete